MELRSLTRISLPKDEYVYLLGMAISVFISNNGFIIENIINTDKSYSWHDLIDKESGKLRPIIVKTIIEKVGLEISDLFSEILYKRNRIIHSFRCTSSNEEQILAVNDTLRMYKNDDIRMYNFNCITDTIVEVITTCNTYTLLTVHLL